VFSLSGGLLGTIYQWISRIYPRRFVDFSGAMSQKREMNSGKCIG
jgi:hypothetical protein